MFRYILFDSSQHLRFHQKLQGAGVSYHSLFEGHAEEILPEMAPLLIDVTVESPVVQSVMEETRRIGNIKPCVSILESTQPIDAVARHLARFHLVETPDDRSLLLRWYDTRILPVWLKVLTTEQRARFTHPFTRWTSIDRFGTNQAHDLPGHDDGASVDVPFRLDRHQIDRLFAATRPDVLIHELRKTLRKEIGIVPRGTLYPFVHTHWEVASMHGLRDLNEQVQFLMLAIYTSGRYMEHPLIAERFASPCVQPERSFEEWFSALPECIWTAGRPLWDSHGDMPSTSDEFVGTP